MIIYKTVSLGLYQPSCTREAEDQKAGAQVDDSAKGSERGDKLRLTVPFLMPKKKALDLKLKSQRMSVLLS
jgi:hypothetical protein